MARPLTKVEVRRVRAAYFNPLKSSVPVIGDPREADCIWEQAFSRIHYDEKSLAGIIGSFRQGAEYDDTKTFELLAKDGFDPGNANRKLARLGMDFAKKYSRDGLVLYNIAQWEIPFVIWAEHRDWYETHKDRIHILWPPYTGPTPNVKRGCILKSIELGLSSPIELAAPVMLARAVMHIWALGWNCIVPFFEMSAQETWVPDSCQYQTRKFFDLNPLNCWLVRETYGRLFHAPFILPLLKGERIVSFSPPMIAQLA